MIADKWKCADCLQCGPTDETDYFCVRRMCETDPDGRCSHFRPKDKEPAEVQHRKLMEAVAAEARPRSSDKEDENNE